MSSVIAIRLKELGIEDVRTLIMSQAAAGNISFPPPSEPKPTTPRNPNGKRMYRHWKSVKERNRYWNLQAKLKRLGRS